MSAFLFDSAYQLVSVVWVAASIAILVYFWSEKNWRGVTWAACSAMCAVVVMIALLADRHIVQAAQPLDVTQSDNATLVQQISQRAWISVKTAEIGIKDGRQMVKVTFQNTGQTPALNTITYTGFRTISDYDDIFKRSHHTRFCMKINTAIGYIENCAKWNDAD